jgi:hypothetical protein
MSLVIIVSSAVEYGRTRILFALNLYRLSPKLYSDGVVGDRGRAPENLMGVQSTVIQQ